MALASYVITTSGDFFLLITSLKNKHLFPTLNKHSALLFSLPFFQSNLLLFFHQDISILNDTFGHFLPLMIKEFELENAVLSRLYHTENVY